MDTQSALLFVLAGLMMPLLVSFVAAGTLWWNAAGIQPVSLQPRHRLRHLITAALALAVALFLVQCVILGVPSLPPREAIHRLPYLLLAGLAFGALDLSLRSTSWQATLAGALVIGGAVGAAGMAWPWLAPAAAIVAGSWVLLRSLAWHASTPTLLIPLGLYAAGTAAVLLATGSLKLAQLAAACAMALLALLAVSLARPKLTLAGPLLCVTLIWLAGLLGQGMVYGDTPRAAGLAWGLGGPLVIRVMHQLLRSRACARGWLAPTLNAAAVLILAIAVAMLSRGEPLPAYEG